VTEPTVLERLARVSARIAATGRNPDEVAIVAVTKGFGVDVCREALASGLRVLGENRVQEALQKMDAMARGGAEGALAAHWHLIGHLQTNKVKQAAGRFALIQTVDSARLAEAIARHAPVDWSFFGLLDVVPALRFKRSSTPSSITQPLCVTASVFSYGPDRNCLWRYSGGAPITGGTVSNVASLTDSGRVKNPAYLLGRK